MSSVKAPWSPGRFLKTLAYFEVIPFWGCLNRWLSSDGTGSAETTPDAEQTVTNFQQNAAEQMVFDFTLGESPAIARWGALDDVVMGGVSDSNLQQTAEGARFGGIVSIANSGGFASVRTRNFDPPLDLSAYQGMQLRLKGDGKRYKLFLRSNPGWDSLAYAGSFDTLDGEWMTVQLAFADLRPVFRARTVQNGDRFNSAQVCSLQLMLSKFEYDGELNPHFAPGEFSLVIGAIAAYS